jgi:aspartokinase
MSIIVQKYGGSSVADEQRIQHVADRIYNARHALTCVIEPEKVEPAVELLHERLALAETS